MRPSAFSGGSNRSGCGRSSERKGGTVSNRMERDWSLSTMAGIWYRSARLKAWTIW